jgi:diaminopimelate decarboxylase
MHRIQRKGGKIYVEGVSLEALADRHGTPLYVYSAGTILDHYRRLRGVLRALDPLVCYSVKANSNLAILSLLARAGSGFDVVSAGELERVRKAGGKPAKCVFAGVGKTEEEIEAGLRAGVKAFHVESEEELHTIAMVAGRKKGRRAPVALRVNPDVAAGGHAKITTGTYANKFGIPFEQVAAIYRDASGDRRLHLRGIQMHIGSQITQAAPFRAAVRKMVPLVARLRDRHGLEYFDIGGGVGIVYQDALASGRDGWWRTPKAQRFLTLNEYAVSLVSLLRELRMQILLEPGRFSDYCPNGLQAEGKPRIASVVCGVTASLALVTAAAHSGADAILVHHGWFWRGDDPRVIGPRRRRLATLLAHDISLFAYHLPLDVHPEFGNNVQLARRMGWPDGEAFGKDGLLRMAELDSPGTEPLGAAGLAASLHSTLGREPLLVGDLSRPIRRISMRPSDQRRW